MKFLILLIGLMILVSGCIGSNDSIDYNEAYLKCTSVCSSVLSDDYVTMHLCNEECKEKFISD